MQKNLEDTEKQSHTVAKEVSGHSILVIGQKASYLCKNERMEASSLLPSLCLGSYIQGILPRLRADLCLSRYGHDEGFPCIDLHIHPGLDE